MVFSSAEFIWFFFPAVLICYYFASLFEKKTFRVRNVILLIFSLVFYAWGEPLYILLMLSSIIVNYVFGICIDKWHKKFILVLAVIFNLGTIGVFKYLNFIMVNVGNLLHTDRFDSISLPLPIGISFYTFQILSYVVDVYRREIKVQKNVFSLALYISFFPQLIAGPIVKYKDIEKQLTNRTVTVDSFSLGVRIFLTGLGKKMILANGCAGVIDSIYASDVGNLSILTAWVGSIAYLFQIYYDFGGYSDMAIGLGKMFGFNFPINFNYPYVADSIKDFWRRWHISLSSWFKDYLYIPLGGNRKGNVRTYINLIIVFFCTGLWHGASWNFIVWGMYHGIFQLLERGRWGKLREKLPKAISILYALLVVDIGWVFFRAPDLKMAVKYIGCMFGLQLNGNVADDLTAMRFLDGYSILIMILSVIFCGLIQSILKDKFFGKYIYAEKSVGVLDVCWCVIIVILAGIMVVSGTYNPFIYFQF